MDEKELQAVAEALNQLRDGGTVSAETLAKLGGTAQSANKALEGYTKKILGAASSIGGMARQVADGEGSFKSLSGAFSGLTSVVGKLAGALPIIGGSAKALAEGVGEAAKFVLEQLDVMAKNYQTLGDASATAADGVDGLMRQFTQAGNYSLPAFTKAVKANSEGLAALGGNAAMGAEQLSKVAGVLTTKDTARQFLKLGIGLDAVGDATAQYLSDFSKSGVLQGLTTAQLTKKTQDYILEVDKIARLTGQTRQQQEEETKKSMANAQFRAQLAQMNASGQQEQAGALKMFASAIGGPAADAIRAYATGIPLTTQAAEADIFTQGKLREITMKVRDGQLGAAEATVQLQDALGEGVKQFGQITAYGKDLGGMFVQGANQQAIANAENKTYSERLADATATVDKLKNSEGKLTGEFVDAQLATATASKNLQRLGFTLADFATPAVNAFATAIEGATELLKPNTGYGKGGRGTMGGSLASTGAGALAGAAAGSFIPGVGTVLGGLAGAAAGYYGYQGLGGGGAAGGAPAGLKLKAGAEKMGSSTEKLYSMAQQVHKMLGGDYRYFSGLKDRGIDEGGAHPQGRAFDLILNDPTRYASVVAQMRELGGFSKVLDESQGPANPNQRDKWAPHIHAEVSAANGAILSGPKSGYRPNLTMHGTEAIVPLDKAMNNMTQTSQEDKTSRYMLQKLDEIAYNTRHGARQQEKTNRVLS